MLIRPLTHPQAADVAPAQPDAQAEATIRNMAGSMPSYTSGSHLKDYMRDVRNFEDEVFTAPADDVPVCDGCGKEATTASGDDVDLCAACYAELASEPDDVPVDREGE